MPTYAELKADIDSRIGNKTADESIDNTDVSIPMKAIVDKVQEVEGTVVTGFVSLPDISALQSYTGNEQLVFVKDLKRGGLFYKGTGSANNGTIFNHATSGQWIRYFDPQQGADPCWFGAIGNAVTNDLTALQACSDYCIANKMDLRLRSGVYRITSQWLIGRKFISETDALIYPAYSSSAPSFNSTLYSQARFLHPIRVIGDARTVIYCDFTPGTLTAGIYYGIIGGGNSANRQDDSRITTFENITITGPGWYNGSGVYTPNFTRPTGSVTCALAMMYAINSYCNNITIQGFDQGMIHNHSYYSIIHKPKFSWCKKSFTGFGFNCVHIDTPVFDNVTEAMDLTGQSSTITSIALQYCEIGIRFRGFAFLVNGCYAENDLLANPNQYQFIIGRDPGDPDYDADPDAETQSVIIRGLNAATANRPIALLKSDCGQVTFSGVGGGEIVTTSSINIVAFDNFDHQTLNVTGPGTLIDLGQVNDTPLPEYSNNAAARAAGLQTNDRYHTAGVVKIVLPA